MFDRHPRSQDGDQKRAVGFAATAVLPGENQEEFNCLLEDLRFQYEPEGPAEADAVETMANAIWRKRHLKIFQRAFEARMKLGTFFKYPVDPHGSVRIHQDNLREIDESMTLAATQYVQKELGIIGADNKEKPHKTAQAVGRTETSDSTTSNLVAEGPFTRALENATAKIKKYKNDNLSDEEKTDIIREEAKKEIAKDKAEAARNKCSSSREYIKKVYVQNGKLMAALETVFGRDFVEELQHYVNCSSIEASLAEFGDLLTPECYAAELRMVELLDLAIDRSHDRLIKLQKSRAKSSRINPLQPDWMARRR
jgi:hypothetical protein